LPSVIAGAFRVVWAAARREFIFTTTLQVASSIAVVAQLLLGREVLSILLARGGHTDFTKSVPYVIALAVITGLVSVANIARFEYQQVLGEMITRHALERVLSVAMSTDLASFEQSSFHDRLQRAQMNSGSRPLQMTVGVTSLVGSATGAIGIGAALLFVQPFLVLVSIIAVVPVGLATLRAGRALYRFSFEQTERDRRRIYLQFLLTNKDSAKEIRAYALGETLRGRYSSLYSQRISDLKTVAMQRLRRSAASAVLTSVLSGGALALLTWLASTNRISLAEAGTAAAALLLLSQQLQGLIGGVGYLYESALFVQDYNTFVEPDGTSTFQGTRQIPHDFREIAVDEVSFRYPNQATNALNDVSVRIKRNEIVALVGENGSGKSTLAKLLAGLYSPSSGVIRWDAEDTADVDVETLRERVTVLFQDFARFQLSLRENISVGRIEDASDTERIRFAAERSGAAGIAASHPLGFDAQLGPEFFGGTELSGGQWQRIALARSFFRDSQVVILDEPTAALDPQAEADLFENIRALFEGRTVVLISHRFGSVRHADRIYVMDKGTVLEQGTHATLMSDNGRYAKLFRLQAASYRDDVDPLDEGKIGRHRAEKRGAASRHPFSRDQLR
jgi:ATP-binding cassette subfamily B protein